MGKNADDDIYILILAEEAVSKDGLFDAKQETFEEIQQGAEASGAPNR